ncbi:MAG TPA: FeoB-associated Cys-rich membrane protein [Desulfosporosinus sp.]
MINWILGGAIVGVTIFIILRTIRRMRNGESSCCGGCAEEGCSQGKCDCTK